MMPLRRRFFIYFLYDAFFARFFRQRHMLARHCAICFAFSFAPCHLFDAIIVVDYCCHYYIAYCLRHAYFCLFFIAFIVTPFHYAPLLIFFHFFLSLFLLYVYCFFFFLR